MAEDTRQTSPSPQTEAASPRPATLGRRAAASARPPVPFGVLCPLHLHAPQVGPREARPGGVSVEQLPAESSSSPGLMAPAQSAGVVCPAREPRVTRTWGMLSAPPKAQRPGVARDTLTPHLPFHPKLAWPPRSATACPHPLAAACTCPTRHLWWTRQPHGPPGRQGQQASPRTAWWAGRVCGAESAHSCQGLTRRPWTSLPLGQRSLQQRPHHSAVTPRTRQQSAC